MKKLNIFILVLVALSSLSISCTREDKPSESKSTSKTTSTRSGSKAVSNIERMLSSYLEEIGVFRDGVMNEGNNEVGFYSFGITDIGVPPNSKDFHKSRLVAFTQAIMAAKFNILKRKFTLMSKSEPTYYKDARVLFKQNADSPFFKEALSKNFSENSEEYFFAKTKTGLNLLSLKISKNFKDLLKDDCYASHSKLADTLKGIFVMKSFEDEKSVAVVLFTGPETEHFSDCILGESEYSPIDAKSKVTIKEKVDSYSLSELYALNLSCFILADKNGDVAILSFGQSVVEEDLEQSLAIARKIAMCNINNFVASSLFEESILVGNNTDNTYSFKLQKEEISNENDINGVEELRQWKAKDEVSGTKLCGVVLALELKNLKNK